MRRNKTRGRTFEIRKWYDTCDSVKRLCYIISREWRTPVYVGFPINIILFYSILINIVGTKMTWKQLTERDCREWKLSAINPHDRNIWRSAVRSAIRAASQLSGRGPTDVDIAPVPTR